MSKEQPQDARKEQPEPNTDAPAAQMTTPRRSAASKKPTGHHLAPLWLATTLALFAALGLSAGHAQVAAQPAAGARASVASENAGTRFPQAPAAAGANAITITSQTQTYTYATLITFQMRASDSNAKISSAQLEIVVSQIGIDHLLSVPLGQPAASVALTYRYDPGSDYFPPFTPITYHWILRDSAQHSLVGADQHFDFIDTRFAWQHLTQSKISVYWYNQSTAYGQNLLNAAAKEATSIEKDLNGTLSAPIRVLVYASNQDLRGGLPSDTPNWAGGVAFIPLDEALIVVGDAVYPLQRDLPHELTHLILHEVAGLDCGGCPLWFDEGMAVYHQLYHEPEMQMAFDDAVKAKQLLAFNSITDRFPDDADQAELAYAQSWNYIKYLYRTYGQPKMARLVDSLPNTAFSNAFQRAFGLSPDQMENQWDASLGVPQANNPSSTTPASGSDTSSQPGSAPAGDSGSDGALGLLGLSLLLLLSAGLVVIFMLRHRQVPRTATGAPWPAPYAGGSAPFAATARPGYLPGMPSGYAPFPPPQGIPTDQRHQWQVEQRQALLRSINEAIAIEKQLEMQGADLSRQIALYAAQERQEYADQREDRALLALNQRRWLERQLAALQQQLARVRLQRRQDMERERQISAEIDAVFSQQTAEPGNSHALRAWPQPGDQMPAPARRISQE